jgi:hypothetical protein
MRSKDKFIFISVALVSGLISLVISNALFGSPSKRDIKVPNVQTISPTFPDIKNDSNYNSFINTNALDPTQPVQIGNSQNSAPFNSH